MRQLALIAALLVAGGYCLILVLLYVTQERLLFQPDRLNESVRFSFSLPFEERWIVVGDTRVHAVHFARAAAPGTILHLHGNAGSLESWGHEASHLARATGWNVLSIDYPGYGKSPGRVSSEQQLHEVVAQCAAEARRGARRLVIFGRSLGTGLAARAAAESGADGLVLVSPYYSMSAVAKSYYPWVPSFVLRYALSTHAWLPRVNAPVLIIHGDADEVVPYTQGRQLAEENPRATFVTLQGSHHNDLDANPRYMESIAAFARTLAR